MGIMATKLMKKEYCWLTFSDSRNLMTMGYKYMVNIPDLSSQGSQPLGSQNWENWQQNRRNESFVLLCLLCALVQNFIHRGHTSSCFYTDKLEADI